MKKKTILIFSSRSLLEANFYIFLDNLISKNYVIYHIAFSEEVYFKLKKNKKKAYNVFGFKEFKPKKIDYSKQFAFHEKREFNLNSNKRLKQKYLYYFFSLDSFFLKLKKKNKKIICIQEAGGFISHWAFYNISKKNLVDHYFIEPSFENDRFFIIKNSFLFNKKKFFNLKNLKMKTFLKKRIYNFLINKKISFITGHKHKYNLPIFKILNLNTFYRFVLKVLNKYFMNKKEDYDYIFKYSFNHLIMNIKYFKNLNLYSKKIPTDSYIYFPLHVPNDMALTVRAPEYINQILLIKKITKYLDKSKIKMVIKEHPAFVGGYDYKLIKKELQQKKIILLKAEVNNFDVISRSKFVITINSKSGAEAFMAKKKVIALGDSFYAKFPKICFVKKINKKNFNNVLNKRININNNDVLRFYGNFYFNSHDGEMFLIDKNNIKIFSKSLLKLLN